MYTNVHRAVHLLKETEEGSLDGAIIRLYYQMEEAETWSSVQIYIPISIYHCL